jgi:hypothetical protein
MIGATTRIVLLAMFLPLIECRHDPTVWKMNLRSPDGAWLATARTDQYGGFGTASVETVVTLQKLNGTVNRGRPFDVLEYPGGGPIRNAYVLSDANGGVNLKLTWLTPTHLEIDYNGKIEPDLQVVKFGGVDISLRQISAASYSGH